MKLSDIQAKGYDLKLVDVGREHTYRSIRAGQKTVQIDRAWHVLKDGEPIGIITYEMLTREQRTPGRVYVNKRWHSPGYRWSLGTNRFGRKLEASSRVDALQKIIRDHERS